MTRILIFTTLLFFRAGSHAQNVGIGTSTPKARLHVMDSSVVFSGEPFVPFGTTAPPPVQGPGMRMMWYARKAAFRAGLVLGTQWDRDNVGRMSFASGANTIAAGDYSTAFGSGTTASYDYTTAMGFGSTAGAPYSTAIGINANASGQYATAMGVNTFAKATHSFTAGIYNDDTDNPPYGTTNFNDRIFQIGNGTASVKSNAITVWRNGNLGIANANPTRPLTFPAQLGEKILLFPGATGEVGMGVYNNEFRLHTDYSAADITFGHQDNASVFTEIMRIKGNGNVGINTANPSRPLSFPPVLGEKILLFPGANGEVGIGVYGNELRIHSDNPGAKISFGTQDNAGTFDETAKAQRNGAFAFSIFGSLWVNGTTYASDERFKQNITAIQSPLEKLIQLNGVEYEMKAQEFQRNHFQPGRQMGLLAQNVEKIVPEAVQEIDGYKGVDYARLVPLLIESIKELNKKVGAQQKEIEALKAKTAATMPVTAN